MYQRLERRTHLPDADVEIVGAGHDIRCIAGVACAEHTLHALCSVDLVTVPAVVPEHSDGAVVRAGHELPTSRRELDIQNGHHKVLHQCICYS